MLLASDPLPDRQYNYTEIKPFHSRVNYSANCKDSILALSLMLTSEHHTHVTVVCVSLPVVVWMWLDSLWWDFNHVCKLMGLMN